MSALKRTAVGAVLATMFAASPAVAQDAVTVSDPAPMSIAAPAVSGRAAFVTQIGDENSATINQSAPDAQADVGQSGSRNRIGVRQQGLASGFVEATQGGDDNVASILQGGAGANVLYLSQSGNGNSADTRQNAAGSLTNGAIVAQVGNGNDVRLVQDGADNLTRLTQNGDNNAMTAHQNGDGNRLEWTQQGNGLSDLGIVQNGGQAIQILQTNGGGQ